MRGEMPAKIAIPDLEIGGVEMRESSEEEI